MTKLTLGTKSLKTRITLLTMGVFLVSIWSLTFFVSRMLHDDLQQTLAEQQFATVTLLAEEIDHEVADRLQALTTIASEITPAMLQRPADLQAFLEHRPLLAQLFNQGVASTGVDGTVLADFPKQSGRLGANFSERDYIIGPLKDGKATVGKPTRSKITQNPSLVMAVPIRAASGGVMGVLAGVVNLNRPNFLDRVARRHDPDRSNYYVVASQHRLNVTSSNPSRIMAALPAPGVIPALDRYAQGHEGSDVFINPLGVEVLVSAKNIPAAGWYVAITLPTQIAFAPIHALQQRMAVAASVLTLLAGLLTWWLLRRQLAPLQVATNALQKFDPNAPFPAPLAVNRADEVGQLIEGFNQMLATLRQRDAALAESEARYRTLIDWTPDAMFVHRDGKFIYVNPATVKLFGASSAQDLLGQPILERIHPDSRQVVFERIRRSQQDNIDGGTLQEKFIRLDGTVIDVEATGHAVIFEGQSATQAVAHDISARVAAQRSRDEALARLQKIANQVPGMVYQYLLRADGSSCFPFASEGLRQLSRYSPEQVKTDASGAFSACHPDDIDCLRASILQSARSLTPWQQEYRVKFDDGTVRWLFGNALPEPLADGAVLWHGFITDITERKLAQDQLRTLSYIVEQAPMSIVVTDLAGNIEYANPFATQCTGYSREELYGQNPRVLKSGLTPPEVYQSLWHSLTAGEVWRGEFHNKKKSGELYVDQAVVAPVRGVGNTLHYVGLQHDITERKRTEQALQASLSDKIALLNEVHHRVKNNLQVISSLLRLEAGRSSQGETRHVLTEMQGRIRAMALLHESLYRAGTFAWVDLGAYLGQLAGQAFRAQSSASVRLQLALDSVRVSLDQATPCGLLLNELISNCLKHGFPEGRSGVVRIDLHAVDGVGAVDAVDTVGVQAANSQWCLRVSDDGVGLSADFESRRTQSLGLQLVADLTQQLKGTLQIEPGPGTAFAVTFTVAPAVTLAP
ncbi:MAG: hypothetical protein COW02_15280 [Comamonadaceae bacterium CG12_big_fil_rev_8_21_14_0_65_59_15]|nr:MAG: hypothetical protein COW02_15280 [Comamonadaceae bacterium CG12_big_fil_rev_8_21_14_0_65_59_15]